MNTIATDFGRMLVRGKLDECIARLEEGLRAVRRTPYHRLLGRDFLQQTRAVAEYMIDFHRKASSKKKIAALYCEMNGFAINTGCWFFEAFGYKKAGDVWDLDWLASWDVETDESFTLEGMESVQKAFGKLYRDSEQPLSVKIAEELAEHLVTARFMQLIAAAHRTAKRRYAALKGLPVLATAHDWDDVFKSE